MEFRHHLESRNFKDEYGYVDQEKELVTFPLYNLEGKLQGMQIYNWKGNKLKRNDEHGRYWTYTPKGNTACWGLEHVDFDLPDIYITEGIFDALAVKALGLNAIAVMTNNPKNLKGTLGELSKVFRLVALCDGDAAGKQLSKYGQYSIILPEGEDADSLPKQKLLEILENE